MVKTQWNDPKVKFYKSIRMSIQNSAFASVLKLWKLIWDVIEDQVVINGVILWHITTLVSIKSNIAQKKKGCDMGGGGKTAYSLRL